MISLEFFFDTQMIFCFLKFFIFFRFDELEEIRRIKTRPNPKGPPVVVKVSIFLNQIFSIDVASMVTRILKFIHAICVDMFFIFLTQTIGLDLYLREEWEDDRITNLVDQNVILPLESSSAFWTPDTYFQNQIINSLPSSKQGYIHVRSRGQVKSEKRQIIFTSVHISVF